jgi:hypothetical protein
MQKYLNIYTINLSVTGQYCHNTCRLWMCHVTTIHGTRLFKVGEFYINVFYALVMRHEYIQLNPSFTLLKEPIKMV